MCIYFHMNITLCKHTSPTLGRSQFSRTDTWNGCRQLSKGKKVIYTECLLSNIAPMKAAVLNLCTGRPIFCFIHMYIFCVLFLMHTWKPYSASQVFNNGSAIRFVH